MTSSVAQRRPGVTRVILAGADASAPVRKEGDTWPHTRRPLPWLLAAFLAMIFLVPFNNIIFKVNMPANATLDRVLLVVMIAVFLASRLLQARPVRRRRLTPVEVAVLTFGGLALLSIVLNIDRIYQQNYLSFVEKQFWQLLAYGVFFFIVIATVRAEEVAAFTRLVMVLAGLTALGVILEARTGYNVFFSFSAMVLSPVASLTSPPPAVGPSATIAGPTQHALALASMLTIALPFAVMPLLEGGQSRRRWRYLVLTGLILAADLSTGEKTATFAPIVALGVLTIYKRQLLRWAPLALIVLVPVIHFAAPGALGGVGNILPTSGGADYTDGRAGDYSAVAPDILNNIVLGRGYGSLDVLNWRTYRILDNQYLDTLFEVGVVGLISYLGILIGAMMTAHGVIRRRGLRAPPALAAAAGCAAFGVVSATYDAAGFPEAVYSFLFAAGLIAVLASKRTGSRPAAQLAYHTGKRVDLSASHRLDVDPPVRSERAVRPGVARSLAGDPDIRLRSGRHGGHR